ncbi:MAG: hypothetical protein MAG453_01277 [Calditrichaeota bacterium]|nr:hypothetical protein [Calditrichota bacterium]
MMWKKLSVVAFAALFAAAMIGCEGEQGPQGPAGPEGPSGVEDPNMTYLGAEGADCAHCHSAPATQWPGTAHSTAYGDLDEADRENPYCLQCHTTGWDSQVAYGDTVIAPGNYGPDEYGYDDYFKVEGDSAAERRAELENVQCESCHGPFGPVGDVGFSDHELEVNLGTRFVDDESVAACWPCHRTQLWEWGGYDRETGEFIGPEARSGHANAAEGDFELFQGEHYTGGSCAGCHTAEGFVERMDPQHPDGSLMGGDVHFIGCTTCHDPHSESNPYQVRSLAAVPVEYHLGYDPEETGDGIMDTGTPSQTCVACHHARRDNDHVAGQIDEGYAYFGPHGSPQMDMFLGYGSYEIPGEDDYVRETVHQTSGQMEGNYCVKCHMQEFITEHGEDNVEHYTHDFKPGTAKCAPCHTVDDAQQKLEEKQTATEELMNDLAVLLGYTNWEDYETYFDSQAGDVTVEQREAAYALQFVINDGSMGLHNWEYSRTLLQNAIDYMNNLP